MAVRPPTSMAVLAEEPIIYPYMDTALTDDEQHQVRDLLADGTLPDGWVCREASPTV